MNWKKFLVIVLLVMCSNCKFSVGSNYYQAKDDGFTVYDYDRRTTRNKEYAENGSILCRSCYRILSVVEQDRYERIN